MNIIKTQGIVLRKLDYGEADRVLHVFTNKKGKIVVFLKGIRKSNRRDKISGDILSLSDFIIIDKNLKYSISDMKLEEPYMELRGSLMKMSIAMYVLKILDWILNENEKDIELYKMSKKYFDSMKNSKEIEDLYLLIYYIYRIVKNQGLDFEIKENGDYFDFENGIISNIKGGIGIRLKEREKKSIYFLKRVDRMGLNGLKLKEKECIEIIGILEKYLEFHLNIKIKFKEFIIGGNVL